jgi:PAS domain S-box-containing protein
MQTTYAGHWAFHALRNLLRWLTEPSSAVAQPDQRERARLLSYLHLIAAALVLISAFTLVERSRGIVLSVEFVIATLYVLSRTRYFMVSATISIFLFALFPFIVIGYTASVNDYLAGDAVGLVWVLLSTLVANLLINVQVARIVAFANIIGIILLPLIFPVIPFNDVLFPAMFVLVVTLFTAIVRRYDLHRVAEQKRLLFKSEADLHRITDHMQDIIAYTDSEGALRYISPSYERIFGRPIEKLIGIVIGASEDSLVHPNDVAAVNYAIEQARTSGKPLRVEYRHRHADGTYIWLEMVISAIPRETSASVRAGIIGIADNELAGGFVITSRDITERKQSEERVRLLGSAVEQTGEAVLITTSNLDANHLEAVFVNPAFSAMTGYSAEEMVGKSPIVLQGPKTDPGLVQQSIEALKAGQAFRGEFINYRKDGSEITVEWYINPVRNIDGQITHFLSIQRDVTERNRIQMLLRESEERFRRMADAAPVMIWTSDLNKKTTYVNKRWLEYAGKTLEQQLGFGWLEIIHPDDRPRLMETYETGFNSRTTYHIEYRVRRHDGSYGWLLDTGTPRFDADGTFAGYIGSCVDITELKQAQDAQRATEAAERDQRVLAEALRDSAAALNSTLNTNEVLDRILEQVARVLPVSDSITVMLIENDEARVVRFKGHYSESGLGESIWKVRFPVNETANLRHMIETRKPFIVYDSHVVDFWRADLPEASWIRSYVGAPIFIEDEIIGFLNLDSAVPNTFTSIHAERLQAFANQAGTAFQNARLFEAVSREREVSEALRETAAALSSTLDLDKVLDGILDQIGRVLPPADAISVTLIENGISRMVRFRGFYEDAAQAEVVTRLRFPVETTANYRLMFETAQPVIIDDTSAYDGWVGMDEYAWIRSNLGAPIVSEGQVIGFVIMDSAKLRAFTQRDAQRLQVFANQAGVAIQNARLYDSIRREREIADTLRDIGLVVNSTLSQEELLQTVLQQVARVLPYDAAGVWINEGSGIYRCIFAAGYERFGLTEKIKQLEWTEDDVLSRNQIVEIIPDVDKNPNWTIIEGFEWIRSWAVAPIIVRGKRIGQFSLDHTQTGFYGPQHQQILESLAAMISVAVGNARMFEAERRQRREIEAVQESSLSLTASLELPEVLDAILRAVDGLFDVLDANVFLYAQGKLTFGAAMIDGERVIKPFAEPRSDGLTYTVARSGEMMIIPDLRNHPLTQDAHWSNQAAGLLGIPLKIGTNVVGVMNIAFAAPGQLDSAEQRVLNLLASQASIAIENARLYEQTRRYADELEERVVARTVELVVERQQLQTILDATGEGIFYTEGTVIQYANRALYEITGYTPEELLGMSSSILRSPTLTEAEKSSLSEIDKVVRAGGVWRAETRGRRKNNEEYDAGLTVSMIGTSVEDPIRMVTIVRDISKDKELEAQKKRFIANASHELRTPITNLQTRLYLTRKQPQNLDTHLDIMEGVADRLKALVEDLLDISRFERGTISMKPRRVLLQDLVTDVARLQQPEAENKRITLICNVPTMPLYVYADPQRILQVITNLITNAINYTYEGGQVLVLATEVVKADQRMAVVHVQDTGMGIAPEHMQQIFQPFFRVGGDIVGTGLGLSIAREIIALHGGEITVESQVGQGSRFSVRLPLAKDPALETPLMTAQVSTPPPLAAPKDEPNPIEPSQVR